MEQAQPISRKKRCAIYTRKSAQAPIAQEITSLESQRAICTSYIASQQHKGWVELHKPYDDAARSGSNLQRPALQELLADVELGLVDVILVYKLDRITRTLLDFVRLIDLFDKYGVVFVAITQNFDTSDSMGRLIRNVLLTFAQFEREIASDRIRDKKRVMKQRGLWTGGDAPIGYDLRRGKLLVNREEEPAIRCIFETYVAKKRLAAVHRELIAQGFRRKIWRSRDGTRRGGNPVSQSSLYHVIGNPVYIGEVTHCGERFQGIHEPIVNRALWDRAQEVLKERSSCKPQQPSNLLTGLLFDSHGRRMHARSGINNHSAYRHYVSAFSEWASRHRIRKIYAKAESLEKLVLESLKCLLGDRSHLRLLLMKAGHYGPELDTLAEAGGRAAARLTQLSIRQLSGALKALLRRVEIHHEFLRILLRVEGLASFLAWDGVGLFMLTDLDLIRSREIHVIDVPASVDRERQRHTLPISPRSGLPGKPDQRLLALLRDARAAQRLIFEQREVAVADLAYSLGRKPASFARLVRLNYLAPDIVAAIIDGEQPPDLTRKTMMQVDLPIDWTLQRRLLGFPERPGGSIDSPAVGRMSWESGQGVVSATSCEG